VTGDHLSSEAWRHECEARHLLDGFPNGEARARYLDGVEKKRGRAARVALSQKAVEIRESRKGTAMTVFAASNRCYMKARCAATGRCMDRGRCNPATDPDYAPVDHDVVLTGTGSPAGMPPMLPDTWDFGSSDCSSSSSDPGSSYSSSSDSGSCGGGE